MVKEKNNDLMSMFDITLPPEATLQLADCQLVNFYKSYKDRVIWIDKEIDETLFEEIKMIMLWNMEDEKANVPVEERKPIKLMIHSYGGNLDSAFAIIDCMAISKTPIYTYNLNACMSAGCLIFLNGHKGHRYCMPLSIALIHEGSGGSGGTFSQVQAQNENYKKMIEMMRNNILSHTDLDTKTLNKWKNKEIYLYADDQIKYGFADSIITDLSQLM